MSLYRDLADLPASLRGGAVSIGNFDGVHQGHAKIVERLCAQARQLGGPAVIFTFEPHPLRVLRPEFAPPLLSWIERKTDLLTALGVDAVVAYPADKRLLDLSAEAFFQRVLLDSMQARAIVEGPNFYFGKDRGGDIELLGRLCCEHNVSLEIVEPVPLENGEFVSSSQLRKWLAAGRIRDVNAMLTQPYRIRGQVAHGASRGATLGFPTANLTGVETLLPVPGVYAGAAWVGPDKKLAAINIGAKPTFGDETPTVEAHLLDFEGDLYNQTLEVELTQRLRDTVAFDGADALKAQLQADIAAVRELR